MVSRLATLFLLGWSLFASGQTLGPLRFVETGGAPRVPLGGDQFQPAAAPAEGGVFLVWTDRRASNAWADVSGALVTPTGRWVPEAGFPITTEVLDQTRPAVCCGDSQCLVAYSSTFSGVLVKRYTRDLQPIDFIARTVSNGVQTSELRCAAGSSGFLVVWTNVPTGRIDSALVAADGTPGPLLSLTGANYNIEPDVAWNGLSYRVVWRANGIGIETTMVSSTGIVGTQASVSGVAGQQPRLVAEGADWAITWVDQPGASVYAGPLRGRRITAGGAMSPVFPLGNETASFFTGLTRSSSTLLAWRRQGGDFSSYVAVWELDGGLSAPTQVGPFQDDAASNQIVMAFDGGIVHVAVERPVATDLDLQAVVLDSMGQPVSARSSVRLHPDWHHAPSIAGSPDGGFHVAFLAPATQTDGGATEVRVARLNADGTVAMLPHPQEAAGYRIEEPLLVEGLSAPGLVWLRRTTPYTQDNPLFFAPLDETLLAKAASRINGPGCCLSQLHQVPMGDATWILHLDFDGSLFLRGMRIAPDGSLLDPPGRQLATSRGGDYASAFATTTRTLMVVSATDPSLAVQRFRADGTPIDAQERFLNLGSYPRRPAIASSGTDFLVAWVDLDDVVRVVSVSGATGQVVGAVRTLTDSVPADAARVKLVFDGREYLLSFDAETLDGGADVLLARFDASGALLDVTPLADGPGEQHAFSLARSGSGRVGAVGLLFEPSAGVLRTVVRVRAAIPLGVACLATSECLVGQCLESVCCDPSASSCFANDAGSNGDAGVTDAGVSEDGGVSEDAGVIEDGGTDAGVSAGPGAYRVGCGCSTGYGATWLVAFALALWCARTPRPRQARTDRGA